MARYFLEAVLFDGKGEGAWESDFKYAENLCYEQGRYIDCLSSLAPILSSMYNAKPFPNLQSLESVASLMFECYIALNDRKACHNFLTRILKLREEIDDNLSQEFSRKLNQQSFPKFPRYFSIKFHYILGQLCYQFDDFSGAVSNFRSCISLFGRPLPPSSVEPAEATINSSAIMDLDLVYRSWQFLYMEHLLSIEQLLKEYEELKTLPVMAAADWSRPYLRLFESLACPTSDFSTMSSPALVLNSVVRHYRSFNYHEAVYLLKEYTAKFPFELLPMASVINYELGQGIVFSKAEYFQLVQTFINRYLSTLNCNKIQKNVMRDSDVFVRGCFVIGMFYLFIQRIEEAKLFFLKVVKNIKNSFNFDCQTVNLCWFALAVSFSQTGDHEQAIKCYESIKHLQNGQVFLCLALECKALKKGDKIVGEFLEKARTLDTRNPFIMIEQLVFYSSFDLSRALNAGLEALNSLESLPLASQKYSYSLVAILLYNLGIVYFKLKKYDLARSSFLQAIQHLPPIGGSSSASPLSHIGLSLTSQAQSCISSFPNTSHFLASDLYIATSFAFYHLKELQQALKYVKLASECETPLPYVVKGYMRRLCLTTTLP